MKKVSIICALVLMVGTALFISHRVFKTSSVEQVSETGAPSTIDPQSKDAANQASKDSSKDSLANSDQAPHGSAVSGAATNGAAASGTTPSVTISEKPKQENNCFVYEFQHKAEAKQKDIEDFMDFTNAFPIAHKEFNAKSLCVKVNQQPVPFKLINTKGQAEVLVGSVVGPESLIRVTYCTGKAMCKENCTQAKKRFMDDLVSDSEADDEFGDSWGNAGEQKKKLQAHVKAFRTVAKENDSLTKQSVIRDWKTVNHQESVCKKEGK